jgi:thiosulfate dehydrogenase (quinone) large subunit
MQHRNQEGRNPQMTATLTSQEELAPQAVEQSPAVEASPSTGKAAGYVWGLTRLSLGWIFLWAFLDKAFGLGFATERADAWINGGSPTFGFLTFGTNGPLAPAFASIAGATWADGLFMLGLAGVGVAFVTGVALRIAAVSGAAMMLLMYAAAPVLANNPFMDDHIVYALVLVGLALTGAGRYLGLGRQWEKLALVRRYPILT